jgi:hypothetical protein
MPDTNQLTPVLVVPETPAVNCCDWPTCTFALVGEMETEIAVSCLIETVALAEIVD